MRPIGTERASYGVQRGDKATRAGPFRPLLSEHSSMGTSQPCALHKTKTAAMAIQPPGATWRHYNPERGERVVRKAVLARCVISNTKRPQQPNIADDDGGQRRFDVGHRLGADYANRDILTSRSLHPARGYAPAGRHLTRRP